MTGIRLGNEEQKQMIMRYLHDQPMTVEGLAKRMLCAPDTVRKRLRELQREAQEVRVVGWERKDHLLVRVWGVGVKRHRPPATPVPPQARSRVVREGDAACVSEREREEAGPAPYRLEALDQWLFAIRRAG